MFIFCPEKKNRAGDPRAPGEKNQKELLTVHKISVDGQTSLKGDIRMYILYGTSNEKKGKYICTCMSPYIKFGRPVKTVQR